jgi:uncharacterized membrane protein YdjX (TVP38/TMEM64 family)
MRGVLNFLLNMDSRAWRALAVSFVLFGGVGLVFVLGAPLLGLDGAGEVERWLGAGLHGPWALAAAVGSFAGLAFLGVPQFVLIAAAVVAFGPWVGFAYSWIGTLVSALIGFALGRLYGASVLRHVVRAGGGGRIERFMTMVGRNGFLASLIVRLVPSAPFIVVNMAAGVTPMRAREFMAGTALGIIPKIALTAFSGAAVLQAMNGGGTGHWLWLMGAVVLWLAAGLAARAWIRRRERGGDGDRPGGA